MIEIALLVVGFALGYFFMLGRIASWKMTARSFARDAICWKEKAMYFEYWCDEHWQENKRLRDLMVQDGDEWKLG